MNPLLEIRSPKTETVDPRRDLAGGAKAACRNSPNQCRPMPLWLKARARAIGFRHDDLVRTHWQKVWRSMVED